MKPMYLIGIIILCYPVASITQTENSILSKIETRNCQDIVQEIRRLMDELDEKLINNGCISDNPQPPTTTEKPHPTEPTSPTPTTGVITSKPLPTGLPTNQPSTNRPSEPCKSNEFYCSRGQKCINRLSLCNGYNDCQDGADEQGCANCSTATEFYCRSDNKCLKIACKCNGIRECSDGSDEQQCFGCKSYESYCPGENNKCIWRSDVCDGKSDCRNGSDEFGCKKHLDLIRRCYQHCNTNTVSSHALNHCCRSIGYNEGKCYPDKSAQCYVWIGTRTN